MQLTRIGSTYLEKLCDYRTSCDVMLGEVDRALAFLADLEKSYTIMSTKTGELHQVRTRNFHPQVATPISHSSHDVPPCPSRTQPFIHPLTSRRRASRCSRNRSVSRT